MALKIYELNGLAFQFDDQDVPAGALEVIAATVVDVPEIEAPVEVATEVKADVPENKAVEPDNKAVADGKPATRAKR